MRNFRTSALRKKRRRKIFFKLSIVVLILFIFLGVPALIVRIPAIQIREIEITGASLTNSEQIRNLIEKQISTKFFYIYPKSNVIFIPKRTITKLLKNDYSAINTVKISFTAFYKVTVDITERKPFALWCDGSDVNERCFFIDDGGYVFYEAPKFSKDLYFTYKGILNSEPVGRAYLPLVDFLKIKVFIDDVRKLGLEPKSLYANSENDFRLGVKGGEIAFTLSDVNRSFSNLSSILGDDSLSVVKNGELTVSQIDLRYGNKIILKREGE